MGLKQSKIRDITQNYNEKLFSAILEHNMTDVEKYLSKGANVNYINKKKIHILDYCIQNYAFDIANYLILNGSDISLCKYTTQEIYVTTICKNKPYEYLNNIINKMNINWTDKENKTLLILSINNTIEYIKFILELKPNINAVDNDGKHVLIYACMTDNIEASKLLITSGISINLKDFNGRSALSYCKSYDMIDLLLNNDANINSLDNNGNTVFIYTCKIKSLKILKLLISKGIDFKDDCMLIAHKVPKEMLKELIISGINIHYIFTDNDGGGNNLLIHCVKNNWMELAILLIEMGLSPYIKNDVNKNAIDYMNAEMKKIIIPKLNLLQIPLTNLKLLCNSPSPSRLNTTGSIKDLHKLNSYDKLYSSGSIKDVYKVNSHDKLNNTERFSSTDSLNKEHCHACLNTNVIQVYICTNCINKIIDKDK